MNKTSTMYLLVLVVMLLGGCRGDIDKHYERPNYLLGTTYEFLEKRGDFTLFLEAVDRTGFKPGLDGSGLFTVFAPSDDAVKLYLTKINKSSFNELTLNELIVLIGYHIVEFSYKPDDFLGFTKEASSDDLEDADGYAHRFKTLSREGVFERTDPVSNTNIKVFQREKFLPIISTTLLKEKRSPDFEADYRFFFPDVTWKGDNKQFYVAGASILESGIPADNGYVYIVDKVIEPLHTVYDAFFDKDIVDKYSLFRKLYDRFAVFEFNQELTQDYAELLGDSLFLMRHYLKPTTSPDLPDLSDEWTVDPANGDFEARMRMTFNSYIPTNDKIIEFCNAYFEDEKDPMSKDFPMLTLFYLLSSHVPYGQEIVLPSDFDGEGIEGLFGEKWPLKRSDLADQRFCSNGLFYGINKVLEPAIFSMITEPLFKYSRFSIMATLFHKTQNLLPLVDVSKDYSIFLLTDTDLSTKYGYIVNPNGNLSDQDILGGRIVVSRFRAWDSDDENAKESVKMEPWEQTTFVKSHTINGYLDKGDNARQFFTTREPFTYIYKYGGDVYDETGEQVLFTENVPPLEYEYEGASGKGIVYEIRDKLEKRKENIGKAIRSAKNESDKSKFSKFYEKLVRANLITVKGLNPDGSINETTSYFEMDWLNGERCMVFAPVDTAFHENYLPTDSLELDRYLKSHFISLKENQVSEYTLPQLGPQKSFNTKYSISLVKYEQLDIRYYNESQLQVRHSSNDGFYVYTDGDIPFFATDGLLYGITKMLSPDVKQKQ